MILLQSLGRQFLISSPNQKRVHQLQCRYPKSRNLVMILMQDKCDRRIRAIGVSFVTVIPFVILTVRYFSFKSSILFV